MTGLHRGIARTGAAAVSNRVLCRQAVTQQLTQLGGLKAQGVPAEQGFQEHKRRIVG
jgi:hypothetical protein